MSLLLCFATVCTVQAQSREVPASSGRALTIEFAPRRTFYEDETVRVHLTWCRGTKHPPVEVQLVQTPREIAYRMELERIEREQYPSAVGRPGLCDNDKAWLEQLQRLPDTGEVLRTLHRGEIPAAGLTLEFSSRDLPPSSYRIRVVKAGARPQRRALAEELFTILADVDYHNYMLTGADYYIVAWSTLNNELEAMVDAKLNTMQAWINPFTSEASEVLDLAAAMGLRDLSGLPLADVPEEAQPVGYDGQPGHRAWYNVCYNNPRMPELIREEIKKSLPGRKAHPGILAYYTINEIHDYDSVCYCEYCREGFRDYLKEHHGSLGALNEAWGTQCTEWSQVEPPAPPEPEERINRYARHDWLDFKGRSMAKFCNMLMETARQVSGLPVGNKKIHHMFAHTSMPSYWFRLSPTEDINAYSGYQGNRFFASLVASLGSGLKRPLYTYEWNYLGAPGRLRGAVWYTGFAHGLSGQVFFKFHPYEEYFGYYGLLERDWSRGEVYQAIANANQKLHTIAPVVTDLEIAREPVAIVFPFISSEQSADPSIGLPLRQFNGMVATFDRLGISTHFIADFQLPTADLSRFKMIVLPGCWCLHPQAVARLQSFVEAGGVLLADYRAGFYDHGMTEKQLLRPLLGVAQTTRDFPDGALVAANDILAALRGEPYWGKVKSLGNADLPIFPLLQEISLDEGTELIADARGVAGYFPAGYSITRRETGEGRAYYFAFPAGLVAFHGAGPYMDKFLRVFEQLLETEGIMRRVKGEVGDMPDWELDLALRASQPQGVQYLMAVNYGPSGERTIRVRGQYAAVRDLFSRRNVPCKFDGQWTSFVTYAPQWEPLAFALWSGQRVAVQAERDHDGFQVSLSGEPGTLVRARVVDARGLCGKEWFGLLDPSAKLTLRVYPVMKEPYRVVVDNMLMAATQR